jgi:quinol monooxygenase YgiN
MPKVELIVSAIAAEGKANELSAELQAMLAPTHAEPGCEFYRLYESERTGHFFFHELWGSEEALDAHRKTPHFVHMKQATQNLLAKPLEGHKVKQLS